MAKPSSDYYFSAHWRSRRRDRLDRAGHCCEFVHDGDDGMAHKLCYVAPSRCQEIDRLQVHHKHYDSVGDEADEDLEVLCELHHIVRHLMNKCCIRCGECAFDYTEDAEAHAMNYQDDDGSFENDILITIMEDAPDLCPYCQHMTGKDD